MFFGAYHAFHVRPPFCVLFVALEISSDISKERLEKSSSHLQSAEDRVLITHFWFSIWNFTNCLLPSIRKRGGFDNPLFALHLKFHKLPSAFNPQKMGFQQINLKNIFSKHQNDAAELFCLRPLLPFHPFQQGCAQILSAPNHREKSHLSYLEVTLFLYHRTVHAVKEMRNKNRARKVFRVEIVSLYLHSAKTWGSTKQIFVKSI